MNLLSRSGGGSLCSTEISSRELVNLELVACRFVHTLSRIIGRVQDHYWTINGHCDLCFVKVPWRVIQLGLRDHCMNRFERGSDVELLNVDVLFKSSLILEEHYELVGIQALEC